MQTIKRSRIGFLTSSAALVALGTLASVADAQRFITTDTTLDSTNTYLNGTVYVGYSDYGKSSPTVNLVPGGSVGGMVAYNNSIVNMSGGVVEGGMNAYDSSTIHISNGSVGDVDAHNNATITFSGGFDSYRLIAYDSSNIIMVGGSVSGFLHADNNSTVTLSGGSIGQLNGANISSNLHSTLNLIGTNLSLTDKGHNSYWSGEDYTLTGTLADGTSLSGYVLDIQTAPNYDPFTGRINLVAASVPEPSSLLTMLLGLGVSCAGLLIRRRRNETHVRHQEGI